MRTRKRFDREAAVGEAELGLANGAAALKAFRAAVPLANPSSASPTAASHQKSLPRTQAGAQSPARRAYAAAVADAAAHKEAAAKSAFRKGEKRTAMERARHGGSQR